MYRFREFEVVVKDSKTDSPYQNSGEIPLPNINQMRRTATQPQDGQKSDDEDNEDNEYSNDSDATDNEFHGGHQNKAVSAIKSEIKKSTNDSDKAVKYYVDTMERKGMLKDQYIARSDLLYRLAESRNLRMEQVMGEAKRIQDEIYKKQ